MSASSSAAVDWRSLSVKVSKSTAATLEHSAKLGGRLLELEGHDLLDAFSGVDGVFARGCIVNGSRAAQAAMEKYLESLPRARKALVSVDASKSAVAYQLANLALIGECTGKPGPAAGDIGLLKPLVRERHSFSDSRRRSMALTALALRDTATALALLDAKPAAYDEPRLSFEFNIHELIRYLAAALDMRRPADWIEPAWLEYLENFPLHLAAQAAEWPDLFMFARVLAELRGDKIADIADDLHARIERLAQETE